MVYRAMQALEHVINLYAGCKVMGVVLQSHGKVCKTFATKNKTAGLTTALCLLTPANRLVHWSSLDSGSLSKHHLGTPGLSHGTYNLAVPHDTLQ